MASLHAPRATSEGLPIPTDEESRIMLERMVGESPDDSADEFLSCFQETPPLNEVIDVLGKFTLRTYADQEQRYVVETGLSMGLMFGFGALTYLRFLRSRQGVEQFFEVAQLTGQLPVQDGKEVSWIASRLERGVTRPALQGGIVNKNFGLQAALDTEDYLQRSTGFRQVLDADRARLSENSALYIPETGGDLFIKGYDSGVPLAVEVMIETAYFRGNFFRNN